MDVEQGKLEEELADKFLEPRSERSFPYYTALRILFNPHVVFDR